MFGGCTFRVQCAFPYIEGGTVLKIARKSERNQKTKIRMVYRMLGTVCAPLSLLQLLNGIRVDFYKPKIIKKSRELSDLECLPTKTQYTKYL